MVRIIWTEPALQDLDMIADYIAFDKPQASSKLVRQIFAKVENLSKFPNSLAHRRICHKHMVINNEHMQGDRVIYMRIEEYSTGIWL